MAHHTLLACLLVGLTSLCARGAAFLHHFAYSFAAYRHGCRLPPKYRGPNFQRLAQQAAQERNYLNFTSSLFKKYGKTFIINVDGTTTIKTCDPQISKAVYSTHFENFGLQPIRYEGGKGFFGDGILVVDGAKWKSSRALIRPAFEGKHVKNFGRLYRHVGRLLEILPKDGSTVDLLPLFKRLTLDLSSEFIFGKSMDALSSPENCEWFISAFTSAQRGIVLPPKARDLAWEEACEVVTRYIDERVEDALSHASDIAPQDREGNRLSLIDELVKSIKEHRALRNLLLSVFSPAHDTVAVTLSNLFFHLARHPNAWHKLRAEVLPTAHQPLSYDLLNSFKYLNWALRETHRLTPIAPASHRACLSTCILPTGGGFLGEDPLLIEKGTIIETNFRQMQRDEAYWGENAEQFLPERWESIRPKWEYIPFSGGPRICPAFKLVYTECQYITTAILRKYSKLENRDPVQEWVEERRLIFQSKNGTLVGLIP